MVCVLSSASVSVTVLLSICSSDPSEVVRSAQHFNPPMLRQHLFGRLQSVRASARGGSVPTGTAWPHGHAFPIILQRIASSVRSLELQAVRAAGLILFFSICH